METQKTPKRPLESLTRAECQTLFALAFGYAPPVEKLTVFSAVGPLTIGFEGKSIILYPNGGLLVTNHNGGGVFFNARKLIHQLDAYNVVFGEE